MRGTVLVSYMMNYKTSILLSIKTNFNLNSNSLTAVTYLNIRIFFISQIIITSILSLNYKILFCLHDTHSLHVWMCLFIPFLPIFPPKTHRCIRNTTAGSIVFSRVQNVRFHKVTLLVDQV